MLVASGRARRLRVARQLEHALLLEYWRFAEEDRPPYYYALLAGAPTRRSGVSEPE